MEGRRRITLHDQMAATTTISLADLLLHTSADQKTDASAATVPAAGAGSYHHRLSPNRTLIDILREDSRHSNTATAAAAATADRRSWKASFNFIDKIRLRLALTASESNDRNRISNNLSELRTRLDSDELTQREAAAHQPQRNDAVSAAEPEAAAEAAVAAAAGPVGVSLMDLLEETEIETGIEDSRNGNRMNNAEFDDCEEEKGEMEEGGAGANVEHNCCVCMVRHKGAAFIPCGHTFCRTCSREVWVSRGNCPLCNNLILEILDIF